MRILVVGAGAVGGYFGGRLLQAGRDVTFLVRRQRAAELADHGLRIVDRAGDITIAKPPTILRENLRQPFDVVLLSVKAYNLADAIESFAPAVGPATAVLPLLNGMRHLDTLDARFGRDRILGGKCVIAATLNAQHEIVHLNNAHAISFGERDGSLSDRVRAIADVMRGAQFDAEASSTILLDMWEKWVFLAALAGITCLMRSAIRDIAAAPGGSELTLRLLDECRAVAAAEGYAPRAPYLESLHAMLTSTTSLLTASMLRDIEGGASIEADHIVGDLLARGRRRLGESKLALLPIVYAHLKAYEARRARA